MRRFDDLDLYHLDSLLTDDERMVRDTVRDERGEHTIQVGFDTWQRGTTNMRGYGDESIAACGAWIAEDTYEVRICFYESEFCPVLRFHYTSDGLLVEVEPNVSWGPTTARKITGRRH